MKKWRLVPFLGVWMMLATFWMSWQEKPEVPPAPNILLAIADDASFPHMSAYGTRWISTPAFDRVAREGLLFMKAYTPNAKCAPSRACILTGRNSWQLEEACNHWPYFPEKFKAFTEALPQAGYQVGHTAKGWAPGIARINDQPRQLIGPAYNEKETTPPARHISTNDYAENFRDFLDKNSAGRPFFFWYGSTEPHRAYEFGAGIQYGGKKLTDIDRVPDYWPDCDTVRTDMLDYAFEIEYFDRHLAKMLDILKEKNLLENTMVIVTADNGMPFPKVKGQMYEADNHLPLAIMWPQGIRNPGRVIDDFVSLIDLAPTVMELAGLTPQKAEMHPVTGKSLTDIFEDARRGNVGNKRDYTLIGKERHDVGRPNDVGYPVRGIIRDDYLYLENFRPDRWPAGNPETGYLNCDGSPTKTWILNHRTTPGNKMYWQWSFGKRPPVELYKMDVDPDCINNLASDPSTRKIQARLKRQLYRELTAQGDPRMTGNGDVFDRYPDASPAAGFYERYMKGEKVPAGWVNDSDFQEVGRPE